MFHLGGAIWCVAGPRRRHADGEFGGIGFVLLFASGAGLAGAAVVGAIEIRAIAVWPGPISMAMGLPDLIWQNDNTPQAFPGWSALN